MATRADILRFITTLREAHPSISYIFKNGACFELYKLLKYQYPEAECYYDYINGHIYTKIDGVFYDIDGAHLVLSDDYNRESVIELEKADIKLIKDGWRWHSRGHKKKYGNIALQKAEKLYSFESEYYKVVDVNIKYKKKNLIIGSFREIIDACKWAFRYYIFKRGNNENNQCGE